MAKILNIIPYKIIPAENGGQKAIYLFCKYLAQQHNLITVSVNTNKATAAFTMLRWFSASPVHYINPVYYFKIIKLIRSYHTVTLVMEHPYMAWLGYLLKKSTQVKWIIRTHNIEAMRFKSIGKWWWFLLKYYEQWSFKKADAVLFITDNDKHFATAQYKINPDKCFIMPFGTELTTVPLADNAIKTTIYKRHDIPAGNKFILFNGMFQYKPNLDALYFVINELNAALQQTKLAYTIIISGKNIPQQATENIKNKKEIILAGFVEDVNEYYRSADVFINPITGGGGIKTKMVEAIANNLTVVSCISGAAGLDVNICGQKLLTVPDNNAAAFAEGVITAIERTAQTPPEFYKNYTWSSIIQNLHYVFET